MAAALAEIQVNSGGGASLAKALMLGDLAVALPVRVAVEIGVTEAGCCCRWRSPSPRVAARSMASPVFGRCGRVQLDEHGVGMDLRSWPDTVDWERLHAEVVYRIARLGLRDTCHLLRARSDEAIDALRGTSVDLLHLDGNHDAAAVAGDLRNYLPLVRTGGLSRAG